MYIQERAELRSELLQNLKERLAIDAGDSTKQRISTQLHELLDLKKTLSQLDDQFSKTIKGQSKRLSSAEKKALKALVSEAGVYSEQVKSLSLLAETHVLWQLAHGDKSMVDLDSSIKVLREAIRNYRAALPAAAVLDNDRLATETVLREILRRPKHQSKSGLSDCNQALKNLLRAGRYEF